MTYCERCGSFGNVHDPAKHGLVQPDYTCPDREDGGEHEASDSLCSECLEYDCEEHDAVQDNLCVYCLQHDLIRN